MGRAFAIALLTTAAALAVATALLAPAPADACKRLCHGEVWNLELVGVERVDVDSADTGEDTDVPVYEDGTLDACGVLRVERNGGSLVLERP